MTSGTNRAGIANAFGPAKDKLELIEKRL